MPRNQTNESQPKYTIEKYTVIRFEDEDTPDKMFECIPDRWFLDETKTRCYWPPNTGASFKLRAIKCEKPDPTTWNVYEVRVVSEGYRKFRSFNIFLK